MTITKTQALGAVSRAGRMKIIKIAAGNASKPDGLRAVLRFEGINKVRADHKNRLHAMVLSGSGEDERFFRKAKRLNTTTGDE